MMGINWDKAMPQHTHYCLARKGFINDSESEPCHACIPRPAKPAAPEWGGEGLPPVGLTNKQFTLMTHISVACNENPETEYEVVAHMFGKVIVAGKTHGRHFAHIVPATACKPIRTKEQRERDELQELLEKHLSWGNSKEMSNSAVDAILAKYELKERD